MKTRRLIALLMLVFFTLSLTGCGKTTDQELAEKKAKELRKGTGTFKPTPRKSY